jgi:hypothetical protein
MPIARRKSHEAIMSHAEIALLAPATPAKWAWPSVTDRSVVGPIAFTICVRHRSLLTSASTKAIPAVGAPPTDSRVSATCCFRSNV